MVKRKLRPYIVEIAISCLILLLSVGSFILTQNMFSTEEVIPTTYVSHEILTDNVYPVINEEKDIPSMLIKPFKEEDVVIKKSYYDYKAENGDDAITYYENTYIQNTGIDFGRESVFNVITVLDGTVLSVTEDDITGKTVKIEHSNNLISIYQSLGSTTVVKGDAVKKGQIIGTSGTNAINKDIGNHLHFELYVNGILVNPNDYFNRTVGE